MKPIKAHRCCFIVYKLKPLNKRAFELLWSFDWDTLDKEYFEIKCKHCGKKYEKNKQQP
jgi:hypothetical protein